MYSCEYDKLGQLISETNGNTTYQYAYDSKGNISSRKLYSGETLVDTDTFTYGTTVWEDRLTGYNNGTITYDSIGNPTSYLGADLVWRGRELSSYSKGNTQISYSYDVDGMRYQKIVKTNGTETSRYDYVYSNGKLILLTHTANGTANTARFIYDSFGEPRGFILNNTSAYLYLKNGQGDVVAIVDENGEILVRYTYNAWGEVEFIVPFGIDPAVTTVLATVSPFTYRGYCYDFDLGMYYLQSRYYDPQICRFINADSTDYLGATGTLLSYNLFAYCENDPVDYVDPSGCYSPSKAKEYALKWAKSKNLKYIYVNSGDCANFVSQCLYAGGINKTSSWYPGYYGLGYKSSFLNGKVKTLVYCYARAWNFAKDLFFYFSKDKYAYASGWYNVSSKDKNSLTNVVKKMSEFVRPGDIMFYSNSFKNTGIYHAVIVTDVKNEDVKISAHSNPRKNESLIYLLGIAKDVKSVFALKIRSTAV